MCVKLDFPESNLQLQFYLHGYKINLAVARTSIDTKKYLLMESLDLSQSGVPACHDVQHYKTLKCKW